MEVEVKVEVEVEAVISARLLSQPIQQLEENTKRRAEANARHTPLRATMTLRLAAGNTPHKQIHRSRKE